MEKHIEKKKEYLRPQLRRVELSLAEVTLGTGCDGLNEADKAQLSGCGTQALGCDYIG